VIPLSAAIAGMDVLAKPYSANNCAAALKMRSRVGSTETDLRRDRLRGKLRRGGLDAASVATLDVKVGKESIGP
jgi:hypothetical protein